MNTPLDEKLRLLLVAQYNRERLNSSVYKSVQAAFEEVNWSGFAKWCGKAADEENEHANKVFAYLAKRQASIEVAQVPQPLRYNGEDIIGNFEAILALEVQNTREISKWTALAISVGDFMTLEEAMWFNKEQADSEAEVVQILSDLSHASPGAGYILIDKGLNV